MRTEVHDEAFVFLQTLLNIVQFHYKVYLNLHIMMHRINSDHFPE